MLRTYWTSDVPKHGDVGLSKHAVERAIERAGWSAEEAIEALLQGTLIDSREACRATRSRPGSFAQGPDRIRYVYYPPKAVVFVLYPDTTGLSWRQPWSVVTLLPVTNPEALMPKQPYRFPEIHAAALAEFREATRNPHAAIPKTVKAFYDNELSLQADALEGVVATATKYQTQNKKLRAEIKKLKAASAAPATTEPETPDEPTPE